MTSKPVLGVICGPTASGKTDISIRLAQSLDTCIISADSRQVYRGMRIGTAQPTRDELLRVKHYFIDTLEVTEPFTCGRFEAEAMELLEDLFRQRNIVLCVGGSGLYIDSLCYGLDSLPEHDPQLRSELSMLAEKEGAAVLAGKLQELDPVYYQMVDRSNPRRLIRALEVCIQTGMPYSSFRNGKAKARPFLIRKIGIDIPREELYERINRRVDHMIESGLVEEARSFYSCRHLNSLKTVGYSELFRYFDSDISLEQAVDLIKRNSRRYAKRQMTWLRQDKDIRWFQPSEIEDMTGYLSM